MLVKAVKPFRDIETGIYRNVGDQWEVTEERFAAINSTRYGTLAEAIEVEEKPARKVATRRKAPAKKQVEEE